MKESTRPSDPTAEQKAQQESIKLYFEYYKHLTTLSTGAIIILSTFLEKLFKNPKEIVFVKWSLIFFIISVISSVTLMGYQARIQATYGETDRYRSRAGDVIQFIVILSFLAGISGLALFAWVNLSP